MTEIAIYECESAAGQKALKDLAELCTLRTPYHFTTTTEYSTPCNPTDDDNFYRSCSSSSSKDNERLIATLPQLLPPSARDDFLRVVQRMESNEWLSQNPDSVDGIPSLHLNLVSNGEPLFPTVEKDTAGSSNALEEDEEGAFQSGIQELYSIVQPYIYDVLLPYASQMLLIGDDDGDSSDKKQLRISDVFLRRYGQDICGGDRHGISAHYDVFSRVTAVVALDDTAADGRNGLFTTAVEDNTTSTKTSRQTSNHRALRRFFPLQAGDAVLHTWDVLHGVDVELGVDRTSLIVWFDEYTDGDNNSDVVSPWLANHPDNKKSDASNDVLQFVLASALASLSNNDASENNDGLGQQTLLYLQSASHRNTFALTRIGSLCEEGALDHPKLQQEAFGILDNLRPREQLPLVLKNLCLDNRRASQELAIRFWLEGAIGGNPLAQKALADELMMETSGSGKEQLRVLAAVLFGLAAQQGDIGASGSLSQVIEFDVASRRVASDEEFWNSPVVQVANAAIASG